MPNYTLSEPFVSPQIYLNNLSQSPEFFDDHSVLQQLNIILKDRLLTARFQPIINLQDGSILGYEGLIRGPSNSRLHAPINLFKAAWEHNLTVPIEHLCRRIVLEQFKLQNLPGKLFLNVSPESLLQRDAMHGCTLDYIHKLGIQPDRVIIELTEYQPTHDYALLHDAIIHYRKMGFEIAIDDLGEGFSSLRLWSELKPEFVKIDMHFIHGINQDPVKMQFVRSIQSIAEKSGTRVIAEGIETQAELLAICKLNVTCGQGYLIAKPHPHPAKTIAAEVVKALSVRNKAVKLPRSNTNEINRGNHFVSVKFILKQMKSIPPATLNHQVEAMFIADPSLKLIPVADNGKPIGLINRHQMLDRMSHPYSRELYGKKTCEMLLDPHPIVVDQGTSLQELSHIIVEADPDHLINGIIVTEHGQYIGLVTGPDLMREITKMQIQAARHANPLTQLPGNVAIHEQIDLFLEKETCFIAAYCDLDHFKPFNDVYGYHRGDEVLKMTSQILEKHCDPNEDFIGHIGGDDFIILFRSSNWENRCREILKEFDLAILEFYSNEDKERGGYLSEDRQGKKVFHSLISLSIGATNTHSKNYQSHHQISVAASDAKKQAKKIHGSNLYIDRRLDKN
jgi:diguanylate cyclase (GGDEF)-like protein